MDNRPTIGVVTVTYNSAGVLQDFLRCIAAQTYRELMVFAVENGSKDSTLELLRATSDPRVTVIANQENVGVAEGNNQGIRDAIAAGCKLILLVNNDTVFSDRLIEELAAGLDSHICDMVCPKILYFDEPGRIWAAGGAFQPLLGYRSKHFGEGAIDRGQFDTVRKVTYAPTCCVLVRKEVFRDVGLMDRRYFVYVDDVDFMYRAMKAGKSLVYLPQATLLHKVGYLTGGKESVFSIHFGTRNRLFFLLKHFGMIRTLPWMMACQVSWLLLVLLRRRTREWIGLKEEAFRSCLKMWADQSRHNPDQGSDSAGEIGAP